MGFGYIGYIWSILGCLLVLTVFGGAFVLLYGVGKRMERRERTKTVVEALPLRGKDAPRSTPPDDAA